MSPEARRAQLLDAARRVFAAHGYHRTAVSDIIAEAGVARGTFYNYFDGKRAAFQAVVEALIDEVEGAVEPIDVTRPIPPQVQENFARVVRALMEPDVSRLLFGEAQGLEDSEAQDALRAFYRRAEERIVRALERGQALGVVRDGDLQLIARMLLGLVKEPVLLARLQGEELASERVVQTLIQLLVGGVLRT